MERNERITELFRKYLAKAHSDAELDELLAYFQLSEHDGQLERLIIERLDAEPETDQRLIDAMAMDVKTRLNRAIRKQSSPIRRQLGIAAAILAVLGLGVYFWKLQQVQTITITAATNQVTEVQLPDGSRVWLNGGASLSYPEIFKGPAREVSLRDGQAFFDVAADAGHPFTVQAGALAVEVLGTSFEITAFADAPEASVAVHSGRVNVHAAADTKKANATLLSANQKVLVDTRGGTVSTTAIDPDDIAGWRARRIVFAAEDFANVIEALERRYGVRFDVRNEQLYQEKITLRLDDVPLETVLDVLSLNDLLRYEIADDSTIVIN